MGLKTMNAAALMALVVICFGIQVSCHSSSHQEEDMVHKLISDTLSSKGYAAMSLILEDTLLKYIVPLTSSSSHQYFTIFVPQDKAFFTLEYGQPPITLFKYQIAQLKISDNDYYSSPFKVESLIPGHPFVLTALPGARGHAFASVNDVKITDWNLYTDKHIAIHGVEDFFDPPATLTSNPLTSVV